jgi:hypothetical protein
MQVIISIVTSLIASAIYAFWLQGREPKIKHSLALATQSILRRLRLRAYLSAIKGEFEVEATTRAVAIQIQLSLALAVLLLLLFITMASTGRDMVRELDNIELRLAAKGQTTDQKIEPTIEETLARKARLKDGLMRSNILLISLVYIGMPVALFSYIYLTLVVLPYVQRRRAFLVRLERLHRILPVVCGTDELVDVLLLERRTSNEASLREFANALVRIGKRHGLQEFVSDFELWPDDDSHDEGVSR